MHGENSAMPHRAAIIYPFWAVSRLQWIDEIRDQLGACEQWDKPLTNWVWRLSIHNGAKAMCFLWFALPAKKQKATTGAPVYMFRGFLGKHKCFTKANIQVPFLGEACDHGLIWFPPTPFYLEKKTKLGDVHLAVCFALGS